MKVTCFPFTLTTHAYAQVHYLRENTGFPAMPITTTNQDDRMVPAHFFKFAALLQTKYRGPDPFPVLIKSKAGHPGGKSAVPNIRQAADIYSLAGNNLKVTSQFKKKM